MGNFSPDDMHQWATNSSLKWVSKINGQLIRCCVLGLVACEKPHVNGQTIQTTQWARILPIFLRMITVISVPTKIRTNSCGSLPRSNSENKFTSVNFPTNTPFWKGVHSFIHKIAWNLKIEFGYNKLPLSSSFPVTQPLSITVRITVQLKV